MYIVVHHEIVLLNQVEVFEFREIESRAKVGETNFPLFRLETEKLGDLAIGCPFSFI